MRPSVDHYRADRGRAALSLDSREKTAAYLVARLPATYAAAHAVLSELAARLGGAAVTSVLDLGAETGAASLAAREILPGLVQFTCVEADRDLGRAGRDLLPDVGARSGGCELRRW